MITSVSQFHHLGTVLLTVLTGCTLTTAPPLAIDFNRLYCEIFRKRLHHSYDVAPCCPPVLPMMPSPGGGSDGSDSSLPWLRPLPLLVGGVSLHGCFRIPRMFQILYRASARSETQQCAPDVLEAPTQTFLSGGRTRLNTHCGRTKGAQWEVRDPHCDPAMNLKRLETTEHEDVQLVDRRRRVATSVTVTESHQTPAGSPSCHCDLICVTSCV